MKKIITKPIIGIIILILGLGLLTAKQFVPEKYGNAIGKITFDDPSFLAVSDDGRYALIDNYNYIFVMDSNCNYEYSVDTKENEGFYEADFDEDGNLYVLVCGPDDKGETSEFYINKYDKEGQFVREVLRESDDEVAGVYAMCVKDDIISFILTDDEYDYLVEYNIDKDKESQEILEIYDDGNYIWTASTDHNGNYALTFLDRTVGILYNDGDYEEMAYCYYDIFGDSDETAIKMASLYDGGVAYTGVGDYYYKVLYSDDASKDSKVILDTSELFDKEDFGADMDVDEVLYISYMNSLENGIALSAFGRMFIYDTNGDVVTIDHIDSIPFGITMDGILHSYGVIVGGILFAIGLVLCIGNAMKWHMNLLWKQIFFTIPLVIVMFVFLTVEFVQKYTDLFIKDSAQRLIQVNQASSKDIDIDKILTMTSYENVWNGDISGVSEILYDNLACGNSKWSENITTGLYLFDYELNGILIANSTMDDEPFLASLDLGESVEQVYSEADSGNENYLYRDGDSVVLYTGTYDRNECVTAATFLFDEDGEAVGMLVSELDYTEFTKEKNLMIQLAVAKASGFILLLIIALFISTYLNTRRLKRAGEAITEIASGNFEARVENYGKDEVGAICGGVNEMAKQLEVHFEELDRNEKFYYKFVPEKFKELLHKESFTDLQLGDAESADLTVLFCDIRSFSLNSEMMTAKENFEFVNVIYGKAGPIIRRHGGFVDKYIGDAVMALFENADDAVAAGRDLYREIVLDKATSEELGVSSINIGIGIHSGMARIGIVGEEERLSGTVISNTVNISSRLESLTKQYNTAMIISKETLDRLSDPDGLSTRYLGMIQVAGVNEVKALYEVLECLDDERRIPREKIAFDFREAIKAYHLGKAEESEMLLSKLVGDKNDPVPNMYYEYVKDKIETGDMEHNVFKFEKK